jgi:hypothetical protein
MKGKRKIIICFSFVIIGIGMFFVTNDVNKLSAFYNFLIFLAGGFFIGNGVEHFAEKRNEP